MKKQILIGILVSFISLISAHTGNDAYDHEVFTLGDWIFGFVLLIIMITALVYLIKWLMKNKNIKGKK